MIALQNELAAWREKLRALMKSATERLREINPRWGSDRDTQVALLTNLYLKFAYLGRWSEQLDEIAFQWSGSGSGFRTQKNRTIAIDSRRFYPNA